MKKLNGELRKSTEDFVILNTQLEEAKRTEKALKSLLIEKEDSCHKLEQEVVDLRRKVEKSNLHVKFNNSITILNEILES